MIPDICFTLLVSNVLGLLVGVKYESRSPKTTGSTDHYRRCRRRGPSMIRTALFRLLTFILLLRDLESVTVVNHHSDEEYFLEHEVPYQEAIAEAKNLQLYPGPIPGCKPCTNSEMTYCKDDSVINDHCCCDGSSIEVFPFVKHTCRVGPEECKVQAGDCAEYARLRECCCHSYLASVWKYLANDAGSYTNADLVKFLAILTVLRLFLQPT